ncbi:osteoclast-stimulating factor 1 isoform 2-T3 [Geothlypis trichas]
MLPRTEPPQGAPDPHRERLSQLRAHSAGLAEVLGRASTSCSSNTSAPPAFALYFNHAARALGAHPSASRAPRRRSARLLRPVTELCGPRPPPSRGGPAHTTLQPARREQPPRSRPARPAPAAPPGRLPRPGQGSGGAWSAARALIGRVPPGAGGGGRGRPGPALRPGPRRRRRRCRAALGDCRASHRRLSPRARARAPITVAPLPRLCLGQPCPSRHLNRPSQGRLKYSGPCIRLSPERQMSCTLKKEISFTSQT